MCAMWVRLLAAVEGFGGGAVDDGFGPARTSPRVFISYAHDSNADHEAVRNPWIPLRGCGIGAQLDLPTESPGLALDCHRREPSPWAMLAAISSRCRDRAEGIHRRNTSPACLR
jgi:hypothetical protein